MTDAELLAKCLGDLSAVERWIHDTDRQLKSGVERDSLAGTLEDIRKKLVDAIDQGAAMVQTLMKTASTVYDEKRKVLLRAFHMWKWGKAERQGFDVALTDLQFQLNQ